MPLHRSRRKPKTEEDSLTKTRRREEEGYPQITQILPIIFGKKLKIAQRKPVALSKLNRMVKRGHCAERSVVAGSRKEL